MEHRAATRRLRACLGLTAVVGGSLACGDPFRDETIAADTGAPPTGSSDGTITTDASSSPADPSPMSTAADSTGGGESSTGAPSPPVALCDRIAIPLVLDPQAPIYSASDRAALVAFFDDIVVTSGAELRIRPNVGTTEGFLHLCGIGSGPDIVWGDGFVVDPAAAGMLSCVLDNADVFDGPFGDGDHMFAGLMFPILQRDDWPPPDTDVVAAMLLAQVDDDHAAVYARPGMTAEAFLRLAGDHDRRRVAAFATGNHADELHTFTLSLNDASAYYDWGEHDLSSALDAWAPLLLQACEEHDYVPPIMPLGGCERIDILFVVDGSASMDEEQDALRGAAGQPPIFADFVDALLLALTQVQDIHVGVISAEPGDVVLHRHTNYPAEAASALTECDLPPAENWITAPSPGLAEQFACIAATRAASIEETTALNAALALSHPQNAGFLRDDSILLVVMLTDEDTQDFTHGRAEIHQMIMNAADDDRSRVIVLAIAGDQGTFEMPSTTCQGEYGSAAPGRRLTSIVRTFRDHGRTQDICAGDFAAIFEQALADVVDVCEAFHPEG